MEDALGSRIPDHIANLRRLIYCGEWIGSHALHMFMLGAPDFLGRRRPGNGRFASQCCEVAQISTTETRWRRDLNSNS
jgi:coenzyme F420-reducing hydrogenase alpha subunit